ncbi:MAG: ABC transporter permease, partial [Clostridia bacterium]|nr:ABC transporter permease [Clostridia bacterium]
SHFPRNYVRGTFMRYKMYILRLVLCGIVFGVAYTGGLSFAHLYDEYLAYNRPAYSLALSGVNNNYSEDMRDDLLSIDGVIDVQKVEECTAKDSNSHILLDKSDKSFFSDAFGVEANGGEYAVTNSVVYRPIDAGMIEYLTQKYDIDGNIEDCLTREDHIVLSNSRYNQEVLKLQPGDEIYIGVYISNDKAMDTIESGKEYLIQQLEHNRYSYRKYTVAAVISGMPTGADSPVYLPAVDYSIVTRRLPSFSRADVYLEEGITGERSKAILEELREYGYKIGDVSVGEVNSSDLHKQREKNYHDFVVVLSLIVLVIMPVLLMFAQILFYLKRDTEMYVLESFGATSREIRRIYFGDGMIMSALSGGLYLVLSVAVIYALNRIGNVLFTYPGFDFEVPWLAFIFGLVITVGVSFLSSVIPFYAYQRKKKELLRSVAGEV